MTQLIIASERDADGLEVVVRLPGKGVEWRCTPPAFDAASSAALRWLLEDYPRLRPGESRRTAHTLAHARLFAFGHALHEALLGPQASYLGEHGVRLAELDIVLHEPAGLTRHWPWELMHCDGAAVVHHCRSFLRYAGTGPVPAPAQGIVAAGPLRVLMVISRPAGLADVPFRSVASRVLRAVSGEDVCIEVLRPPTLDALRRRLMRARDAGEPFDVVHFDGHGSLVSENDSTHGALMFEEGTGSTWAKGKHVASILRSGRVPILLLNACRSAQAPLAAPRDEESPTGAVIATASLAEEVAAAGVEVVAMSHAVHVASAAQVVSDVYAMLARHRDVADAVRFARLRWRDETPAIDVEEGHAIVQHFGRPVVHAAEAPMIAYPDLRRHSTAAHPDLPAPFQAAGIVLGLDDIILTLEQQLRPRGIVELRGLRGSGKTTLLLELGRWLVATRGARPEDVHYVDLEKESLPALTGPAPPAAGHVVLVDNAWVVHGDPLQNVPAWETGRADAWRESVAAVAASGALVVVATCAPVLDGVEARRLAMTPLEIEDLREIASADDEGARIPDLALLWTGGNPGSLELFTGWARDGHFADAARTWMALRELSLGAFVDTKPPPLTRPPRVPTNPGAMFQPVYLAPWMVAQFPARMSLDAQLVKMLAQVYSDQLATLAADDAYACLEQAGLLCRTGDSSHDVHPLATCFIPTPVHDARNATTGHWNNFRLLALFAAHLKVMQFRREGGAMLRGVRDPIGSAWWLPSLIQSWRMMGELLVHHELYLSLGRGLRERLLDAGLDDAWDLAFADMCRLFERHPPDAGPEGLKARLQWLSLQTMEARRAGDPARELQLARDTAATGLADPDAGMADVYDALMKLGRAEHDPGHKKAAFEQAFTIASDDPTRKALAELELARVLRSAAPPHRDLAQARERGESALRGYRALYRSRLADASRIAEATLTLSLVYLDLLHETGLGDAERQRGEDLCRESLSLATTPFYQANAAYDLGLWRLQAGDAKEAEGLFLKSLTLYEATNESEHVRNKARFKRLQAIDQLVRSGVDRAVEARLLATDLLPRLLADADAPDAWKRETYRIAGQ